MNDRDRNHYESKRLLETARRHVETAIEQDEQAALEAISAVIYF